MIPDGFDNQVIALYTLIGKPIGAQLEFIYYPKEIFPFRSTFWAVYFGNDSSVNFGNGVTMTSCSANGTNPKNAVENLWHIIDNLNDPSVSDWRYIFIETKNESRKYYKGWEGHWVEVSKEQIREMLRREGVIS